MPFRGVVKDFKHGEAVQLVVAGENDVQAQIAIRPYGATGTSGAPNFYVGGPKVATEGGMLVTSNEFSTDLEPGDELWVTGVEELPFAASWTITAIIRSTRPKRGRQPDSEA